MNLELFAWTLALTLGVVGAALIYLRATTRRVLRSLCDSDDGAAFWLRVTDVLALSGSLMLVLAFGGFDAGKDWILQLRLSLGLALAGLFATVLVVASSVWRQVAPPVAAVPARAAEPTPADTPAATPGDARALA